MPIAKADLDYIKELVRRNPHRPQGRWGDPQDSPTRQHRRASFTLILVYARIKGES